MVLEKKIFIIEGKDQQISTLAEEVKTSYWLYLYLFLTYEVGNGPSCLSPSFAKRMKRKLIVF